MPKCLRDSVLLPTPKSGKNLSVSDSYWPISLASNLILGVNTLYMISAFILVVWKELNIYRYDIMMSCWSLEPMCRPRFRDMVIILKSLLVQAIYLDLCQAESELDFSYLELCQAASELDLAQSLCWKERPNSSASPASSLPTTALPPIIQEQNAIDEDNYS